MVRMLAPLLVAVFAMILLIPREQTPGPDARLAQTTIEAGMTAAPQIAADAGNGFAGATLQRQPDGHFYADALVNGATIRFLVDSGASDVVLTRADAQRAGIASGAGEFTATAQSANGAVKLKPVTIDRVAIGAVSANRVSGAVAEGDLPISLLGQSFLARISRVEISGDQMRLR